MHVGGGQHTAARILDIHRMSAYHELGTLLYEKGY